jgi:hypothetical protein
MHVTVLPRVWRAWDWPAGGLNRGVAPRPTKKEE